MTVLAGKLAQILGHWGEAVQLRQRSIALDLLDTQAHIWLSLVLIAQDRLDEAKEVFNQALDMHPQRAVPHLILGRVCLLRGEAEAAHEEMQEEPEGFWQDYALALSPYAVEQYPEADAALQALIDDYSAEAPFQIAEIYAFRGEVDRAFEWRDRAYDEQDNVLTETLVSFALRALHEDARWPAFLARMGLPQPDRTGIQAESPE